LKQNFRQRATSAYKALTNSQPINAGGSVMRNYAKQASFRPQEQLVGITYKAIDKIGQSLSIYEAYVCDNAGKVINNDPILNLIYQPNPNNNGSNFTHTYGMLFEIYGETFWYLAKGQTATGLSSGKVKEVYLLDPASVEVQLDNGVVIGYILHKQNGDKIPFLPEEIIHDKRPNPFNPFRGMSVLERAGTYVDIETTTSRFTLNYMRNNASPSGIVSLPSMSSETFKQFTQQWREGYEGAENAGKTAFIRGGEADFKAVGATLHDIDQKITRDMAKDDVLMMFDVPKPLLGMSDGAGFGRGNVDSLNYIFAQNKIEPMMCRLDDIWTKVYRINNPANTNNLVEHETPIPEDKEFILNSTKAGVNIWLTVNEARARENLAPLPDGDVLHPPQFVNPMQTGKTVVLKKKILASTTYKSKQSKNEKHRKQSVALTQEYAVLVKKEIAKFAHKQGKIIIANIERSLGKSINRVTKIGEEWLPSIKEEAIKMAKILEPLLVELAIAQGDGTNEFLGVTGEFFALTPEMRTIIHNDIIKISGVYNKETLVQIEDAVAELVASGSSLDVMTGAVADIYKDAEGYRAERIAQTESLRTTNATAEEVYFNNGFSGVQWFANPNACEFCASMDGNTKEIRSTNSFAGLGEVIQGVLGGEMSISYDDVNTPPLHPNCECSLVPAEE